jgi:hypothetical protein
MNSAMPRLRVFVAANESILLGDLSSEITQRTLICPFLELFVRGSLLHKIEDLNAIRSGRVVFTDEGHMYLIVQLGISKRPCLSSGGGIRHLEQLVTSRLFDPWSLGRMQMENENVVEATADQSHVPLCVPLSHRMASAPDKAPAVISVHTPSSSLALVHSGVIVYLSQVLHTSSYHPFASYNRIPDIPF